MTRGTERPACTPEMYREVFESSMAGQVVLDDLVARFTERAVTDGGIDAVLKTYLRMGENNVVQHIVRQINRANGVPDNQESNE